MKRKMMLVAACAAVLWSAAAMAVPSVPDVQAAIKSGDYPKAETMMQEVVAAKPQSAKAHYLYAEILAHDAKFADATAQARQAREIDPTLAFASDPEKFKSFERLLQREQAGPAVAPQVQTQAPTQHVAMAPAIPQQAPSSGIPGWVWVGGLAIVLFLVFRAISRRAMANNMANGGYANANQGGYGMNPGMPQPGYGPGYGAAPGAGGGLLRTGLAAAGGVAGGMLLERMLEGNRHDENYNNGGNNYGSQGGSYDNGSGQAASELENRPMDFGSGGNDWGGDAGGGSSGGSDDGGGW
jgi:hypothetical protein